MQIAKPFVALERDAELGFERRDVGTDRQARHKVAPLPAGDRHDHQPPAVGGRKVAAEGAVEVVAVAAAIGSGHQNLRQLAEMPERGGGEIAERQADLAARTAVAPRPFGGEQAEGAVGAGQKVPGRQHAVDRLCAQRLRPGHHGNAGGGVDGVVDRRRAVAPAHDAQRDQIGAQRRQRGMAEKTLFRKIGHEQSGIVARRRRQPLRKLAALGPRQVDHHRLLALVQPLPVEARSIRRLRPAMPIRAAADRIDPDHLGTHLRQMQPARRSGNERRRLDHPQALENVVQLPLQVSRRGQ